MIKLNVHEAKTHLSRYLARLKKGQTILLCRRNTPVAEIRPLPSMPEKPRPIGLAKEKFHVPPSFFEPLPKEIINDFRGGAARSCYSTPVRFFGLFLFGFGVGDCGQTRAQSPAFAGSTRPVHPVAAHAPRHPAAAAGGRGGVTAFPFARAPPGPLRPHDGMPGRCPRPGPAHTGRGDTPVSGADGLVTSVVRLKYLYI